MSLDCTEFHVTLGNLAPAPAHVFVVKMILSEKVSMSKIRQRLSSKHQEIAERLTVMLTKSVKDQAQVNKNFDPRKIPCQTRHCRTIVNHQYQLLTRHLLLAAVDAMLYNTDRPP